MKVADTSTKLMAFVLCAAMLLSSHAPGADSFPDDHGDTPEAATGIVPDGSSSNITIEIDTDEDWFCFTAQTGVAYRADIIVYSIWDAVMELRAQDRESVVAVTNSSRSRAPVKAMIIWTNGASEETYYLGVSGYLRFTTGTCSIAVQPYNGTNSDGDGLSSLRRPVLSWQPTASATWYRVYLTRNGAKYYDKWLQQTDTAWKLDKNLPGGSYSWWVQGWSRARGYGQWSTEAPFTVPTVMPGNVTLWAPSDVVLTNRPVFSWDTDAAATFYQLFVYKNGSRYLSTWIASNTNYVPVPHLPLANYRWWVRTWNPDGYGIWSDPLDFTYGLSIPIAPTGVVMGTVAPIYAWQGDGVATWCQLYITRNGTYWQSPWCQTGVQTGLVTTAISGHSVGSTYRWWVRGWGPDGTGPWSKDLTFTVQ